jgi:hypothetical protein
MGDTLEHEAITEALAIIDQTLGNLRQRELVSTTEMSDLLLDVRSLLADIGIDPAAGLEDPVLSNPN